MSGLLDKVRRAGQYRILNHKPPFLITCGYPKCLYIDENGPMMTIYSLFALIVALRKSCHRCQPSPTVADDYHWQRHRHDHNDHWHHDHHGHENGDLDDDVDDLTIEFPQFCRIKSAAM